MIYEVLIMLWSVLDQCYMMRTCQCYNEMEYNCYCSGMNFKYIPTNLGPINSLYVTYGDIRVIKTSSLLRYNHTMTDLSFTRMKNLRFIECGILEKFLKLKSLRVVHTSITQLPKLKNHPNSTFMHILDFESNKVQNIFPNNFAVHTEQLFLGYNQIKVIDGFAFNGSEIGKLSLRGNKVLVDLCKDTFTGLENLRELDLSDTSIKLLPTSGLHDLEILRVENTYTLKVIPSIYDLHSLQMAFLTYFFHCCAFQFPARHNPQRHLEYMTIMKHRCDLHKRKTRMSGFGDIIGVLNDTTEFNTNDEDDDNDSLSNTFHEASDILPTMKVEVLCGTISGRLDVYCEPKGDALNPCEDMLSWSWLRISVWFVLITAIFGNITVLVILVFSKTKLTVSKFLMIHLSFADLCMAAYLLLLASMDIISTGSYFNYAYNWQRGSGCKVAGFLTVFASQLSMFTLTIITVERWYAIKRALYENLITVKLTSKVMLAGWLYSLFIALLPLVGVSKYSTTSICLPMDISDTSSVVYVLLLLMTSGSSFAIICICYIQIYLSLSYETRHSSGERSIANKMTLLVGTNFICWAPVTFFSLTALAGYPLINVTQSKILLVFIYPINSCANPYLYVILTKQFRRDLKKLCIRYVKKIYTT